MASTNKTTNYELSQFIETDRPAWLTDYNSDMRKLDTALKGVSDVASGASGSISSLTDRMTAAEGAISTSANDIDALEARADALEAQAQSTAGTIANIQTEQTAQNLGIEAATELGYNLARPYDSASTYAVGDYVLFQNTLYKCVTAVSTGEAFDPTKWLAIKATDEISAGGYTLPIASASQLGGVKVGSGLSIDPGTGILSTSGGATTKYFDTDELITITSSVGTISYIKRAYFESNGMHTLLLDFTLNSNPTAGTTTIDFELQSNIIDLDTIADSAVGNTYIKGSGKYWASDIVYESDRARILHPTDTQTRVTLQYFTNLCTALVMGYPHIQICVIW